MKHFWRRLYGLFRLRIQLWKEDLFGKSLPKTNLNHIEHKPKVYQYTRKNKGWSKKKL